MDLIRAIQRDNREWVGKFYLKKAVSFALEEKFTLWYEYFKEGLNLLTCDCDDGWLAEYESSRKDLFQTDVVEYGSVLPYLFVKAYILSFDESDEGLKQDLSFIDGYIEKKPEEHAYYIKGRILSKLDDYEKALNVYLLARKFKKNCSGRISHWKDL